jgi:hypothetical protein
MEVLPQRESGSVFAWLETLSYPWSSAAAARQGMPALESLSPVAGFLGRIA